MNRNIIISIAIVVAALALGALWYAGFRLPWNGQASPSPAATGTPQADEAAVREVIAKFGEKMRFIPLAASAEITARAIEENYGPFISADLLAAWKAEPIKAPGRMASSPWPDRIEILLVETDEEGAYIVQGKVIEVTSVEAAAGGGIANQYAVAMKLRKRDGAWIITGFTKQIPI